MSLSARKKPNPLKKKQTNKHPFSREKVFFLTRSFLTTASVLRPHAELLRARGDVFLLRPLGHPGRAALPLVEEAHHAVTAGGFVTSSVAS